MNQDISNRNEPGSQGEDQHRAPPAARRFRSGYWPDRRFGFLVALCAVALITAKLALSDDSSFHITLLVSTVVCGLALLIWFAFLSAYPRSVRVIVSLICLITLAWLPIRYRVQRFTGTLIPVIVRRDMVDPDERLPEITVQVVADLSRTTEDDFPQFLGPNRDAQVQHPTLDRDWQAHPPQVLWRRPVGAGWSGFAAVNGYAVTLEQRGGEELVTCYQVATGQPQWSSAIKASHDSVLGFKGPRSTPTIYNGRVYAMGATGVLRCLDGATGATVWQRDFFDDLGITQAEAEKAVAWGRAASPLIVGETVVVPVGGAAEGRQITLAALDLHTGEIVWESDGYQASYASPALITLDGVRQIVSVNENYVTGHLPETGELLWEYPWDGLSNLDANCSQPVGIDANSVLLTKGYGRGAERIRVTYDDGGWQVESIWQNRKALRTKFSNVCLRDGFAYGLDDGVLSCIDLADGERLWRKGRYHYGQNLLVQDLLLVVSETGELALVEANPDAFNELGLIQVFAGQTWNNPCLFGHYLLLRNSEEAACLDLAILTGVQD